MYSILLAYKDEYKYYTTLPSQCATSMLTAVLPGLFLLRSAVVEVHASLTRYKIYARGAARS